MPMSCSLAAIRLAKAFGAVAAVLVTAVPSPAAVAQPWRPVAQAGGAGEGPAPGVILVESMAQAGVVALGIHILTREIGLFEASKYQTLFTDASVEFGGIVPPGTRVVTTARRVFFRRLKLRSECEMRLPDGTLVCSGTLAGMGVPR